MDESMREDLIAIDRALGRVPIPAALEQRVLRPQAPERSVWPLVVVGVVAAVVLAVLAWPRSSASPEPELVRGGAAPVRADGEPARSEDAPAPTPVRTRWGGRLGLDAGCEAQGDEVLAAATGCRVVLSEPALAVEVLDHAELRPATRGVAVQRGMVLVSVEHLHDPREPVRVEVGGGTIEVTGTRFLVAQGEHEGYVHLMEGSIRFVPTRGEVVPVAIGEPLAWNRDGVVGFAAIEAVEDPELAPTLPKRPRGHREPTPSDAATSDADLDALLDEVAALRRRGEYREAVTRLRRAREQSHHATVREVLSFEEGTLRERYEGDPAVCSYWRGHLARFPKRRYDAAIARRMADHSCPPPLEPPLE